MNLPRTHCERCARPAKDLSHELILSKSGQILQRAWICRECVKLLTEKALLLPPGR